MDDDGEMVDVSTNGAGSGWDMPKSRNTRLRERIFYEMIEPLKHSSSVNIGKVGVICRGWSFKAENGHKEAARYWVPKKCSAYMVKEWH